MRLKALYGGLLVVALAIALLMPGQTLEQGHRGVKWEPGYYIKVIPDGLEALLQRQDKFDEAIADRYVKGFLVSFSWRQLEPERDRYNLDAIHSLLDFLDAHDKYLIVSIEDRDFTHNCEDVHNPIPDYVYRMEGVSSLAPVAHNPDRQGCAAQLWRSDIMERYIKLVQVVGDAIDAHPRVVAYSSPESALRVDDSYAKEDLAEQYRRLAREAADAFPTSVTFISLNWLGDLDNLRAVAEELALTERGGIMTPDTVPSRGVDGIDIYPIIQEFKGQIAIAPRADTSLLTSQDTEAAIQAFAVNELGANYLIWNHWRRGSQGYIEQEILPTIQTILSHPEQYPQLIQQCPSTFPRCISEDV